MSGELLVLARTNTTAGESPDQYESINFNERNA
jgi:hypothetical protein